MNYYPLDKAPTRYLNDEIGPLPAGPPRRCTAVLFSEYHYLGCHRPATRLRDGVPGCGVCARRKNTQVVIKRPAAPAAPSG